jgi:hypothetical protein
MTDIGKGNTAAHSVGIQMIRIGRPMLCYVRLLFEQSCGWNWKLHVVICYVRLVNQLSGGFQNYALIINSTSPALVLLCITLYVVVYFCTIM